jgi:hypothetical protein
MKKIIMIIAILSMVMSISYFEHNYIRPNCEVTQICDGIVTVIDETGETWDFIAKGYKVGDIVDVKMHDNYTSAYVYDDIVKGVE